VLATIFVLTPFSKLQFFLEFAKIGEIISRRKTAFSCPNRIAIKLAFGPFWTKSCVDYRNAIWAA
jgi:hypothetical protein